MSAHPGLVAERAREQLRRLTEHPDLAARLAEWSAGHPTLPCGGCGGRGQVDPVTRTVELYGGGVSSVTVPTRMCEGCQGLGRVFLSPAESWREYRRERAAFRREVGGTREDFGALVRMALRDVPEPAPGHWLTAARLLRARGRA